MLALTQSGTIMLSSDTIDYIIIDNNCLIATVGGKEVVLGVYKNHETAKAVLENFNHELFHCIDGFKF